MRIGPAIVLAAVLTTLASAAAAQGYGYGGSTYSRNPYGYSPAQENERRWQESERERQRMQREMERQQRDRYNTMNGGGYDRPRRRY